MCKAGSTKKLLRNQARNSLSRKSAPSSSNAQTLSSRQQQDSHKSVTIARLTYHLKPKIITPNSLICLGSFFLVDSLHLRSTQCPTNLLQTIKEFRKHAYKNRTIVVATKFSQPKTSATGTGHKRVSRLACSCDQIALCSSGTVHSQHMSQSKLPSKCTNSEY